jgi:hypothetical protein
MRRNFESGAVDKMLPQRWCSGDDARIVYERWQKLFDDFDEKKIEKFDPARVSLGLKVDRGQDNSSAELLCRFLSCMTRSSTTGSSEL